MQGVQGREELVTLSPRGMAAVCGMPVLGGVGPRPIRHGRSQERVDRRALVGGGLGVEKTEVHGYSPASRPATPAVSLAAPFVFSTRTAVALNSAVPDFGSVASIVSTLTST